MPRQLPVQDRLRVSEIFYSLQGESRTVGWPTVFIRLTGCPLRCLYCDTRYAFQGGEWMSIADILQQTAAFHPHYITVTGGEPLAQKNCLSLLVHLCDADYAVSLETSGALDIAAVDPRVSIVMDLKTPSSGEESKNRYLNIGELKQSDQIKFVLGSRADYDWARSKLDEYALVQHCEVLFSPVQGALSATDLADWILADRLSVRMQIQLHKLLWGDEKGR
ncbi:7-carboxy-7-deazaguanine synthase [hydrothermal vent metagenome]|uniref:7-carboxy-7-deazaguanine synthase n=1 Tax=hydrothermal vent metagenome TaxID=652676 RepID=A0A3B1B5C9_9ZZZZ